jgi:hypothetical protein
MLKKRIALNSSEKFDMISASRPNCIRLKKELMMEKML